jgi:hypothetical protein
MNKVFDFSGMFYAGCCFDTAAYVNTCRVNARNSPRGILRGNAARNENRQGAGRHDLRSQVPVAGLSCSALVPRNQCIQNNNINAGAFERFNVLPDVCCGHALARLSGYPDGVPESASRLSFDLRDFIFR